MAKGPDWGWTDPNLNLDFSSKMKCMSFSMLGLAWGVGSQWTGLQNCNLGLLKGSPLSQGDRDAGPTLALTISKAFTSWGAGGSVCFLT